MLELILNADVYAPAALGHRHLLVAGGRIAWMGTREPAVDAALGVRRTDLEGARLIPGLIDGHAHVTGGGGEAGFATRVPPVPLSRFTSAGVTTVVGVLGTDDVTRNTAGLLAQTRALNDEGITAYCHTGGYHVPPVTLTGSVSGDIAHIDRIIGLGELAVSDHRSSQPTLDELLRIASACHTAGLITGKAGIVHLHVGDGERGLDLVRAALATELPARTFNPTHVNRRKALFEEAVELARRGVTIDVTAFPVADGEDAWSAEDALVRYLDSGAPAHNVTVSSDGGGCLPVFDADGRVTAMDVGAPAALPATLAALLGRGVPLPAAVAPFTANVARLLRLQRKGCIEAGADADLVVLDKHDCVRDVMAAGRWHRRDGRNCVFGTFETGEQGIAG